MRELLRDSEASSSVVDEIQISSFIFSATRSANVTAFIVSALFFKS